MSAGPARNLIKRGGKAAITPPLPAASFHTLVHLGRPADETSDQEPDGGARLMSRPIWTFKED